MKKSAALLSSLAIAAYALPLVAFAQSGGQNLQPIKNLVVAVGSILNILIPVLIAMAIVVFFWGLVKYIRASGEGHAEGQNTMIAGLVSLFIMVSVWGIVNLAQSALGVSGSSKIEVPQIPVNGSGQ